MGRLQILTRFSASWACWIVDAHPTDCSTIYPPPPSSEPAHDDFMCQCVPPALQLLGNFLRDPPWYWLLNYSPPPSPPMPSLSLTGGRD